jgi:hypothetical protein
MDEIAPGTLAILAAPQRLAAEPEQPGNPPLRWAACAALFFAVAGFRRRREKPLIPDMIQQLLYSIDVFHEPNGSLLEMLARTNDLETEYAAFPWRARNGGTSISPCARSHRSCAGASEGGRRQARAWHTLQNGSCRSMRPKANGRARGRSRHLTLAIDIHFRRPLTTWPMMKI